MMERLTRGQAADELREQAASCRRLARRARTPADHFDSDARRIDPLSFKR